MSIVKAYGMIAEAVNEEAKAYLTHNKVSAMQTPAIAIVDAEMRQQLDEHERTIDMNAKPVLSMPNWSHEVEFYVTPLKQSASIGIRTPKSMAVNASMHVDLPELKNMSAMLLAAIRSIESTEAE